MRAFVLTQSTALQGAILAHCTNEYSSFRFSLCLVFRTNTKALYRVSLGNFVASEYVGSKWVQRSATRVQAWTRRVTHTLSQDMSVLAGGGS